MAMTAVHPNENSSSATLSMSDELEMQVGFAADALRDAYGMNVVTRFTEDMTSGGAWLMTFPEDRIGKNKEVGITFEVVDVEYRRRMARDMQLNFDAKDDTDAMLVADGHDPASAPSTYLRICAHIANLALVNKEVATSILSDPKRCYARPVVIDIEQAVEFLRENASVPADFQAQGFGIN